MRQKQGWKGIRVTKSIKLYKNIKEGDDQGMDTRLGNHQRILGWRETQVLGLQERNRLCRTEKFGVNHLVNKS